MINCPFRYSDIQCVHGKRYRHVAEMPQTLLDEDLPKYNLMYVGECFKCTKVTISGKSVWKYEIDRCSKFWSA